MDYGESRIGVAFSPAGTRVVLPLDYVPTHPRSRAMRLLTALVKDKGATAVYIGLPKHLSGAEGASASKARRFGSMLAAKLPGVRVAFLDERRSTLEAQGMLRDAGVAARSQKSMIDSTAATVILERALKEEAFTGVPAGEVASHGDSGRSGDE